MNTYYKKDNLIRELNENKFDIVFFLGQDNLEFDKKNEFVIYQGSHGDKGAELADIILPGAAYTAVKNQYITPDRIQRSKRVSTE